MSVSGLEPHMNAGNWRWRGAMSLGLAAWALAGCAPPPAPHVSYSHGHEHFSQSKYGRASRKVVADGEAVPHGGGQYLVGRPYTVAGRRYYPAENPSYTAVGMASWYGAAFHGRRTANGEVYDMASLSAAHPTMPLPSYARVTNLENGYSVIVRVNDRGPYHAGRVMDVSSRVADVLDMKAMGTAKVKVDYVGAGADGGIGRFAIAGEPSHRRIASQYDWLLGASHDGQRRCGADRDDLVVLFRRRPRRTTGPATAATRSSTSSGACARTAASPGRKRSRASAAA